MHSRRRFAWPVLTGGILVASVATMIFWISRHKQPSVEALPMSKLRQLTESSSENSVSGGAISPDGKYLAYTDSKHVYLKSIETDETEQVSEAAVTKGREVEWGIGPWFPDSKRFLVNSRPFVIDASAQHPEEDTTIWDVSVRDRIPHKLRSDAVAYSISPDGSLVSFGANKGRLGDREIWLMGPNGEGARKLFDTDKESSIFGLSWSSDGKRALYMRTDQSGDSLLNRDLNGGLPTPILGPAQLKRVFDLILLPDGRLLYSVEEPGSVMGSACNFWELHFDEHTGKPSQEPRRITNWSGFCMSSPSVTSDGKKLVFLRWASKMTSYTADLLDGGTRILHLKHFPLTESSGGIIDWTLDSKSIIFSSNRSGQYGLYKQSLDQAVAEPLDTLHLGGDAHLSPDGQSVVFLGLGENGERIHTPQPVMRVFHRRRAFAAVVYCPLGQFNHLCAGPVRVVCDW